MGLYLTMTTENNVRIINRIKVLFVGNIFNEVLRYKKQLTETECMEIDKEYTINIQDIPGIIKHYEELLGDYADTDYNGEVGIIRHQILDPLKKEWDYRISNNTNYTIKID